jgi:hypothetical protein
MSTWNATVPPKPFWTIIVAMPGRRPCKTSKQRRLVPRLRSPSTCCKVSVPTHSDEEPSSECR